MNVVIEGTKVRIGEGRAFITRKNRKCEMILDAQFKRVGSSLTWRTEGKTLDVNILSTPKIVDEEAETKVIPQDTSSDTQPE